MIKTAEKTAQTEQSQRKPRLSPELNEFLHMLNALETEFAGKPVTAR